MLRKYLFIFSALGSISGVYGYNQTEQLSPVAPEYNLPYRIRIDQSDFSLPNGIQSFASAQHDGKWLFLAGTTNNLEDYDDKSTFPYQEPNKTIYVVDPKSKKVYSRSLKEGFSAGEVDSLAVISAQSYQSGNTLYLIGGYGEDSQLGEFTTKDTLSAINVPGLMDWVVKGGGKASDHVRQISHPAFQITGGSVAKTANQPTLLLFGQNFQGSSYDPTNGIYSTEVRRFNVIDDGKNLTVALLSANPMDSELIRRDANVIPIIKKRQGELTQAWVGLSGVFTPTGGVWTLPVEIAADGSFAMHDPQHPSSFKQGMNHYSCPNLGLFSEKNEEMYTLLLGGISYGFMDGKQFLEDPELPFINQASTIAIDKDGNYSQHVMGGQYPLIASDSSNAGNPLLFGAGAQFIPVEGLSSYSNGVLDFDALGPDPVLAGYVVGGIQSSLPNTDSITDSSASPYIFKVTVLPVPLITDGQTAVVSESTMGSQAGALLVDGGSIRTEEPINSATQLTFRKKGGTIDTNGHHSVLSGTIWGPGNITKIGQGTLALTGDAADFTGNFRLNEGSLYLSATCRLGGSLKVESNTEFGGFGVAGDVTNDGLFVPGKNANYTYIGDFSPDHIYLHNFTQNENGTLRTSIDPSGTAFFVVIGKASLGGSLVGVLPDWYHPELGTKFKLFEADSIEGRFDRILTHVSPTIYFKPEYEEQCVTVTLTRDYLNPSLEEYLTDNEKALAAMLNGVFQNATPDLNHVLHALDWLPDFSSVALAYEQLLPRTAEVQSSLIFSEATFISQSMIRRMQNLRQGCQDPDTVWSDGRLGVYLTGKTLFGCQQYTDKQYSYSSCSPGVTTGIDYEICDTLFAGLMFAYANIDARLGHPGGHVCVDEWNLGCYGTYELAGFYADALFMYGWDQFHIKRKIEFGKVDRKALSESNGSHYTAYGNIGYEGEWCKILFEPSAAIQYTNLDIDRYSEKRSSSLNLRIQKQNAQSLIGFIGGTLSYPTSWDCWEFMPTVRAFYGHEFEDGARAISAEFVQVPNSAFKFKTGEESKNFALLGAGVSALVLEDLMLFLDYDAEVGRKHLTVQSIQGGLRYQF